MYMYDISMHLLVVISALALRALTLCITYTYMYAVHFFCIVNFIAINKNASVKLNVSYINLISIIRDTTFIIRFHSFFVDFNFQRLSL